MSKRKETILNILVFIAFYVGLFFMMKGFVKSAGLDRASREAKASNTE